MGMSGQFLRISFRKEDFQVAFLRPFLLIFLSALTICEIFFLISGNSSHAVVFVILPTLVTLLCTAAVSLLQARYKFGLGPAGIRCYDFWCRPQSTAWEDVADIKLVNTAGLEYLQIVSKTTTRPIWLPLFVRRDSVLRQMLMTYTHHSLELNQKLESIWTQSKVA